MLKRSLLTGTALLLILTAYLVSLLPLLLVRNRLEEVTLLLVLCLWVAVAALLFPPLLGWVIKKCWFFKGTGDPVHLEELRRRLLKINNTRGPVRVLGKGDKLIITWRYEEQQWCELLSRLGVVRLYELHCRFDSATRTVLLADRMRIADFLICPEQVRIGFRRIPLPFFRVRPKQLGTVEQYAATAPHEYDFHPREIKSPVMGTILTSGWDVCFSLF